MRCSIERNFHISARMIFCTVSRLLNITSPAVIKILFRIPRRRGVKRLECYTIFLAQPISQLLFDCCLFRAFTGLAFIEEGERERLLRVDIETLKRPH